MTPDPTPSKAARRAADAIVAHNAERQTHEPGAPLYPSIVAAIIERETGAGEAFKLIEDQADLIREVFNLADLPRDESNLYARALWAIRCTIAEKPSEASTFLQRFNQD